MTNSKYIFLILASLLAFGCASNGVVPTDDAGVFSDSSVVNPDVSVDTDLGVVVDPDAGTPDSDTGVVVTDDAGTDDVGVVADLGTDSNVEADAGPVDLGIPDDLGTDAGSPDVGVVFPPGETIYYVWIPETSWAGIEEAEDLCASYGGKVPTFFLGSSTQRTEFLALDLSLLQPVNPSNCDYPVNDHGFSCASYCPTLPNILDQASCTSACPDNSLNASCNYLRAFPEVSTNVVYSVTTHPIQTGFYHKNRQRVCNYGSSLPCSFTSYDVGTTPPDLNANLICVLPESADFSTGSTSFPTFPRVVSDYFTALNAI